LEDLGWAAYVPEERAPQDDADPLLSIISRQTELLTQLAKQSRSQDPFSDLMKDGAGSSSQSLCGSRWVAARRLLVDRLRTNDYYVPIEARMQELTAEDDRITYPLDYLKTTSMMGARKNTVMWMFLLGHIHTALVKAETARARALTALAIMAGEQMTLDEGSWVLAWQMTMLPEPPVAIVAARRYAADSINPHSPLAEQRWVEAQLAYLKDADNIIERRNKRAPVKQPKGKGKGDGAAAAPGL
jgi:hypothetical protein